MSFSLSVNLQIFVSVCILIVTARVQIILKPYILPISTGLVTVLSGLGFEREENIQTLNMLFMIIIIVFNVKFLLEWLYILVSHFRKSHRFLNREFHCLKL